jgi:hypothetical protein
MEMSERPAAEVSDRRAFFTLSLLIDNEQMGSLVDSCWPHAMWDQTLLENLQRRYADSSALNAAINPMFDDIADRARNLFLRDFLLDTPNPPVDTDADGKPVDERAARMRNVCAQFDLELKHPIRWQTEGRSPETFEHGGGPIRFDGVLCRAFWMAHSNEALSYHLSLEVAYGTGMAQHYGLSMLQKAFFNSEGTDWLLDDGGGNGWHALEGAEATPLLARVEALFEAHLLHLLKEIGRVLRGHDRVPPSIQVGSWQRLVLRLRPQHTARPGTSRQAWAASARHRRLLVVISDPVFFETLERARSSDDVLLNDHKPFAASKQKADTYHENDLIAAMTQRVGPRNDQRAEVDRYATSLFLSGFLQNIVDFLQQDGLEVYDGLSPIYPAPDASSANEGFMLYATPSVMYEVVSSSRSLEGGRPWIGTCPYIFLVHMTAFHNESLVLRYENNVSRLVGHLQNAGLKASDRKVTRQRFDAVLDHAYECIRDFRLVTFEQVHKHYSFNVFRYETEQTFFNKIEMVRGVGPRRAYWDDVLEHLTATVDGLKQDREGRFERRIGRFGFLFAAIGLIQIWLAFVPFKIDGQDAAVPVLAHGLVAAGLIVALAMTYRYFIPAASRRSGDATSWRTHGDGATTPEGVTPSR